MADMRVDQLYGECSETLDQAIRAVLSRMRIHGAEADDLAQEVRVAVLDRDGTVLRACRGSSRFPYFYRVALGVIVDRLRGHLGRRASGSQDCFWSDPATSQRRPAVEAYVLAPVAENAVMALRAAARTEAALAAVLKQLEPVEVAMLRERFTNSKTVEEVGGTFGLTRRQADLRLHRLFSEIRDMLRLTGITAEEVGDALTVGIEPGPLGAPPVESGAVPKPAVA